MMKKKTYFIAGVFWKQEELNFTENERARAILKKGGFSMKEFTTDKLGEVVEKLYEGGVLRELIPIVLKKDDAGLRRFVNIFHQNIISDNVLEKMTDSDIAEVMLDFFLFKTLWIQNLLGITKNSKLSLGSILKAWKMRALKKQFTKSAPAILPSVN